MALSISANDSEKLMRLIEKHLPNITIWAFGSRVKNTNRPTSDLDLIAFVKDGDLKKISEFKEACDESNLTLPVDIHAWSQVPQQFHEVIKSEFVLLQK